MSLLRGVILGFLGFAVGTALTYAAVVVGTLLVWDWLGVHDQDGGGAMALGLVIGPAVAVVGGIVGAIVGLRFAWRPRGALPDPTDTGSGEGARRRSASIGAAIGVFAGYFGAQGVLWLFGPPFFASYWVALFVSWIPFALACLGALAGWRLGRTVARS